MSLFYLNSLTTVSLSQWPKVVSFLWPTANHNGCYNAVAYSICYLQLWRYLSLSTVTIFESLKQFLPHTSSPRSAFRLLPTLEPRFLSMHIDQNTTGDIPLELSAYTPNPLHYDSK